MSDADTIVALASAAGQAGIGVVRVSGPATRAVMRAVCGRSLPAREACLVRFLDDAGVAIDQGIALYFAAPHSYTGEDVLELQAHGGPVVLRLLVQRCLRLGARLAEPGEFTRRAFLNDKLDLAQAEAVADLIAAGSEKAARSAMRSLQGDFSALVRRFQERLTDVRAFIEAALDFPEEDIDPVAHARVHAELRALLDSVGAAIAATQQGALLRDGLRVALSGAPNVGKSSIINALAKEEVAIVTPLPGTTRDLIRETIVIDGLPVHIVDTAGLRTPSDPIEEIGITRSRDAIADADVVLLVAEHAAPDTALPKEALGTLPAHGKLVCVHNKIDLTSHEPAAIHRPDGVDVWISAKTGAGLNLLREAIVRAAGWSGAEAGTFMARERHVQALQRCRERLDAALALAEDELVAEELRQAQQALSVLTGEMVSDDLLGEIFSRFCIGK